MYFRKNLISMTLMGSLIVSGATQAAKTSDHQNLAEKTAAGEVKIWPASVDKIAGAAADAAVAAGKAIGAGILGAIVDNAFSIKVDKSDPNAAQLTLDKQDRICRKGVPGPKGCIKLAQKNTETGKVESTITIRSCGGVMCGKTAKIDNAVIGLCADYPGFWNSGCGNNIIGGSTPIKAEYKAEIENIKAQKYADEVEFRKKVRELREKINADLKAGAPQEFTLEVPDEANEVITQADQAPFIEGAESMIDSMIEEASSTPAEEMKVPNKALPPTPAEAMAIPKGRKAADNADSEPLSRGFSEGGVGSLSERMRLEDEAKAKAEAEAAAK